MEKESENIAWKSSEHNEIIEKALDAEIIKPGDKVIDIGSGFGRNANWLAEQGVDVTDININEEELEESRERAKKLGVKVNYIKADATNIPLKENRFDGVIDWGCSHALDRKGQALAEKEATRIIKPGGYLLFFGFNKNHPNYNQKSPKYRDMEDLKNMYGNDFEILKHGEIRWNVLPEEKETYKEHVGEAVLMIRKQESE